MSKKLLGGKKATNIFLQVIKGSLEFPNYYATFI